MCVIVNENECYMYVHINYQEALYLIYCIYMTNWKQNDCIAEGFPTAYKKLNLQLEVGAEDLASSAKVESGKTKR